MNPILSSTIEFDNYLQDRLQTSRSKQRTSLSSKPGDDRWTGASSRSSVNQGIATTRPPSASKTRPSSTVADIDTSNQFLSLNANKYDLNNQRPTRPSSSNLGVPRHSAIHHDNTSQRYNTSVKGKEDTNDVDKPVEFVHSWKHYVQQKTSNGSPTGNRITPQVHIPSSGLETEMKTTKSYPHVHSMDPRGYHNDNQFLFEDYDDDEPKPKSPLKYNQMVSQQENISSRRPTSKYFGENSVRTKNQQQLYQQIHRNEEDVAMPFVGVKFRINKLSKFFHAWKEESKKEKIRLYHLFSSVANHRSMLLCQFTLRTWFFVSLSEKVRRKKLRIKRRYCFNAWRKRVALKMKRGYIADRFRYAYLLKKAILIWKRLLLIKAMMNKIKIQSIKAYKHRLLVLLKSSFFLWKTEYNTIKLQKALRNEHNERKSKIQTFIQRLDQQRQAPKDNHHLEDHMTQISNNTRSTATKTARSSSAIRQREVKKTAPLHDNVVKSTSIRTATPSKVNRDEKLTKYSSTLSNTGSSSVQNEDSPEPKKSPRPILPSSLQITRENSLDILPPPPSYRQFVQESSPHKLTDQNEGFSLNALEQSLHEHVDKVSAKPDSNKELSRKERIIFLRQQAMQRVQEKQKEQEQRTKEKLSKEAEEAERIRQEARQKKEQEKQKSVRTLALMEEQNRKMKVADDFRRKHLLICYGLSPWNRYMDLLWNQSVQANQFFRKKLLHRFWNILSSYTLSLKTERVRTEYRQMIFAATFHKRHLLAKTWKAWRLHRKSLKTKALSISGMFTKSSLLRKCMKGWKIAYERSQRDILRQLRSVSSRGDRCRMKHYFRLWNYFINERRVDREINLRSEMKWREVQSWIHK